jgi:class 3 adenylate cyclase/pimeloyl-ACP methyl ester carboxylesterase
MSEISGSRRLAAIVSADVVGYSRLMEQDETGTLASLNASREGLIHPTIAEHHGRIVKLIGDGTLIEFSSVVDAVTCAIAIQAGMARRNDGAAGDVQIQLRIGIHLGDIIIDGDDIYGDGVNVAARIEGLADPGGVYLSQQAYDQIETKLDIKVEDLGERQVKNISRPIHVYRLVLGNRQRTQPSEDSSAQQEIRFCRSSDGVSIAYATVGEGLPLVKKANWLNHLEYDWQSPVWSHLFKELSKNHHLIRYDERGNGLSEWDVDDISLEAFVRDLEAVVDANGLEKFALLGISQGCPISIAYAARHPERVTHLVLYGGYAKGWAITSTPEELESIRATQTLMRLGWGRENPAFRQLFTTEMIPDATTEQMKWFNDLQRITTSPENAIRINNASGDIDVSALLSQVTAPTLVLHCRNDANVRFENGREVAASIPGARFVALEGQNHLILEADPVWPRFAREVGEFLQNENR